MPTSDATRFGLVADIHSNRQALDRVLDYLAEADVGAILCLGDVVGYGGEPGYCVERVRERCDAVVAGNHDLAVSRPEYLQRFNPAAREAIERQVELLSTDERAYLAELPLVTTAGPLTLSHSGFTHPEAFRYVRTRDEARTEFDAFTTRFGAIGHTHVAALFRRSRDGTVTRLIGREANDRKAREGPAIEERRVPIGRSGRVLMNPGAVGQPRDGDRRASLGVVDVAEGSYRLVRLAYDISGAQDAIRRNGMPLVQAGRLAMGM